MCPLRKYSMSEKAKLPRFESHEIECLQEKFGESKFLKQFQRTGKRNYKRKTYDGIWHGVNFHIRRSHVIFLEINPALTITHHRTSKMINKPLGIRRPGPLFMISLWEAAKNILHDRKTGTYTLMPSILKENLSDPNSRKMLAGGATPITVVTAKANVGIASEHRTSNFEEDDVDEILRSDVIGKYGFFRTINELDEFIAQIHSDLEIAAAKYFSKRNTVPKLIRWLECDPSAGGTSRRMKLATLYYVQGDVQKALKFIDSWERINQMERKFTRYFVEEIKK